MTRAAQIRRACHLLARHQYAYAVVVEGQPGLADALEQELGYRLSTRERHIARRAYERERTLLLEANPA